MPEVPDAGHATTEQLSAYLDARLDAAEHALVDQHLSVCRACGEDQTGLGSVRSLLRSLPPVTPPRSFELPANPRARTVVPFRTRLWAIRGAASLAAAMFVALLGMDLLGQAGNPTVSSGGGPKAFLVSAPAQDALSARPAAETARVAAPTTTTSISAASTVAAVAETHVYQETASQGLAPVQAVRLGWIGSGIVAVALAAVSVFVGRGAARSSRRPIAD